MMTWPTRGQESLLKDESRDYKLHIRGYTQSPRRYFVRLSNGRLEVDDLTETNAAITAPFQGVKAVCRAKVLFMLAWVMVEVSED